MAFEFAHLLALLLFWTAPVAVVAALVLAAARRVRGGRSVRGPLLTSLGAGVAFLFGWQFLVHGAAIEWTWMQPQLATIQRNAAPIIDALRRFEAAEHRAPRSFDELIPRYLAELPSTGCSSAPEFLYGDNESGTCGLYTWGLTGDIDDDFIYAPEHLPMEDEGMTTRFGDWIYYDG